MLQLIYVSTARSGSTIDVDQILAVSQRNNRRDGITGLLHHRGRRFLQALEGAPDMVEKTYARIAADPRHFAIVILSRREVAAREFGDWAMAVDSGRDTDRIVAQVASLVEHASPGVRGTFEGFAAMRAA
ncbi:activator of photopigment and puc with BLUF domain protein [Sphingomonas sp. Leaf23]|uniref:BLUF domain-containing protein n=1 Tax=Sphingomonas sp. Leaf23 TaxID=1735689 RepID=UPI000702163A|nr:BLUF domain-containing protein [Sphingomonas sp. Leaf23]KQM88584.1 activator of photopigment and puc with BLUF domain protein [Sphingomonas sp. Leaf23]